MKTKGPLIPSEKHRPKIRHRSGDGTFKTPPASKRTSRKKAINPGIVGRMSGDSDITPSSGLCDDAFNGGDEE
jgi:hypothetical protein